MTLSKDISFLVGETGVDRNRLEIPVHPHQLTNTMRLNARFFYALFRADLGFTDLGGVLQLPRDNLLESLRDAVGDNIVAIFEGDLGNMVD